MRILLVLHHWFIGGFVKHDSNKTFPSHTYLIFLVASFSHVYIQWLLYYQEILFFNHLYVAKVKKCFFLYIMTLQILNFWSCSPRKLDGSCSGDQISSLDVGAPWSLVGKIWLLVSVVWGTTTSGYVNDVLLFRFVKNLVFPMLPTRGDENDDILRKQRKHMIIIIF